MFPSLKRPRGEGGFSNDAPATSGLLLSGAPVKKYADAQSQAEPPADTLVALLNDMATDAAPIDDFLHKVNAPRAQAGFTGDSDEVEEGSEDSSDADPEIFEPRDSVAAASPNISLTADSVGKLLDGVAALRAKMARIGKTLDQFDRISSEVTVVNASGDAAFSGHQFLLESKYFGSSSVKKTTAPSGENAGTESTPTVEDVIDVLSHRLYDILQETAELADDARQKSLHDQARGLANASFAYEPRDEGGVELPPWLFAGLQCDFFDSDDHDQALPCVELKRVSQCSDRPPRVLAKSPVTITRSQRRNTAAHGGPPIFERRRGMCYLMWKGLEESQGGGGQAGGGVVGAASASTSQSIPAKICPEYDSLQRTSHDLFVDSISESHVQMLVYLEPEAGDDIGAGASEEGTWAICDLSKLHPAEDDLSMLHPVEDVDSDDEADDADIVREGHAGRTGRSLFRYYPKTGFIVPDYDYGTRSDWILHHFLLVLRQDYPITDSYSRRGEHNVVGREMVY